MYRLEKELKARVCGRCSSDQMELAVKGQRGWLILSPIVFLAVVILTCTYIFVFLFPQTQDLAGMASSVLAGPEDLQEEGEYVDDVQIDVEGSKDVFLRAQSITAVTHQELCIKGQELGKENTEVKSC